MKIGVADNNRGKFVNDLIERWREESHEVTYEMGFNPKVLDSSDVYFIDTCDNNAKVATKDFREIASRNKLFVRLLDIETWVGHPGGVDWSVVDGLIFINERIRDYTIHTYNLGNVNHTVIPCGIRLDKFDLKESPANTGKIAVVLGNGRIYIDKQLHDAYKIIRRLREQHSQDWTLHVLGTNSNQRHYIKYLEHLLEDMGIEDAVFQTDYVEDVNEWLEDKTFLIAPGMKEAFGYAIGEAMAKGIIPIINNFWGAKELWPSQYVYNDPSEAVGMIVRARHDRAGMWERRAYVESKYSFETFYNSMNQFLGVS